MERGLSVSFTWTTAGTGYRKEGGVIDEFIAKIYPAAKVVEAATGIPWRFAMIQAAHESRFGQSKLTVEANNLFGMTTGAAWEKAGRPNYLIETQEYDANKNPYMEKRLFRRYGTWQESLEDWASLIVRKYPAALIAARNADFIGFAKGLQQGGYATDPNYAIQLVRLNQDLETRAEPAQVAQAPEAPPPSEAPPQTA